MARRAGTGREHRDQLLAANRRGHQAAGGAAGVGDADFGGAGPHLLGQLVRVGGGDDADRDRRVRPAVGAERAGSGSVDKVGSADRSRWPRLSWLTSAVTWRAASSSRSTARAGSASAARAGPASAAPAWSHAWPGSPAGSYALVGAAAMLGAATQAPLTGLVLTLELTHGGFAVMVPMIAATVIATVVARHIDGYSIYTARLRARPARQPSRSPG